MQNYRRSFACLLLGVGTCLLTQCDQGATPPSRRTHSDPIEHIDEDEKKAAAKLLPAENPVQAEINLLREKLQTTFAAERFDELEQMAETFRATKAIFGNGSWKIFQFYNALEPEDSEPLSAWKLHLNRCDRWLELKPESVTAHIALADFLVQYAWKARGNGFAAEVTAKGVRYKICH